MDKNKKEIPKELPKPQYFEVKVETMVPAILSYRVLALDAQQAADKIKHLSPNSINYKFPKRKDLKLMVYNWGTIVLKFVKNLRKYV